MTSEIYDAGARSSRRDYAATPLLAATLASVATMAGAQQSDAGHLPNLEIVIVTAQKREQNLLEVPMPISAIGQQEIESAGITRVADLFRRVPSMAVIDQGAARKNIIIRGIQTSVSTEESVTDVYLDEQRITSAIATADPRTFDMERVEVLRGPQGTLFGGGSLAGTLRYITNRPDLAEFETNVAASTSYTSSADINYSLDGMVNVPIVEDKFAVRLVGYHAHDSGYLSNTLLGFDEVADFDNSGVRIGFRFAPTEKVNIDYKYVWEDLEQNGFPEARGTDTASLDQARATLTEELLTSEFQIHDLTWTYDLAFATLLSSTGYLQFDFVRRNDRSLPLIRDFLGDDSLDSFQALAAAPPEVRLFINDDNDNYTFSQEFRLTSHLEDGDRLAWMVAAYYEDGEEDVNVGDFLPPGGGATLGTANYNGAPADFFFREQFTTHLEQLAVFGEFTYFFTDDFNATVGYRHSEFESFFESYALIGDEPDENGDVLEDVLITDPFKESFDTFRFNASYKINEDAMIFVQSAEGFRLGFGSEVPPPLNPGCETFVQDFLDDKGLGDILVDGQLPGTTSDTLWMHEIGAKGSFSNGRGTYSMGLFYGDWTDILIEVEIEDITGTCNSGFTVNAASATSQGVEAEFSYAISDQFSLSGSGSYVDATLDNDEPFLGGVAGERLPASPDLQFSLSGDYIWPMQNEMTGFLRIDAQYIGGILGAFEFGDPRTVSGDYGLANVRAGIRTDRYEWTLFVDNATDNDAEVFSNGPANEFRRTIILRPLTVGLQFRTRF